MTHVEFLDIYSINVQRHIVPASEILQWDQLEVVDTWIGGGELNQNILSLQTINPYTLFNCRKDIPQAKTIELAISIAIVETILSSFRNSN